MISVAHDKAHHRTEQSLRLNFDDECWQLTCDFVLLQLRQLELCLVPVESHRLREDYLISRRHANNQATRYVLNPQLIEKAFDFSQGAERAALWQERVTMCCNKCALEKDRTTRASDEKFRASERANERLEPST
jgi:hypothetical protein